MLGIASRQPRLASFFCRLGAAFFGSDHAEKSIAKRSLVDGHNPQSRQGNGILSNGTEICDVDWSLINRFL